MIQLADLIVNAGLGFGVGVVASVLLFRRECEGLNWSYRALIAISSNSLTLRCRPRLARSSLHGVSRPYATPMLAILTGL